MASGRAALCDDSVRDVARALIEILRDDLSRILSENKHVAISLSGGMDSTLLAKIASERSAIKGLVAGTQGSIDIINARRAARECKMDLVEVIIDEKNIHEAVKEICRASGINDPLIISFELPIFLALKSAEENIILTGQGADELFGGYAKYVKMSIDEFEDARRKDIDRMLGVVVHIEDALASSLDKKIIRPFSSREMVDFASDLPIEMIFPERERKLVIRAALSELGLKEAASMNKKAAQYGSGTSSLLRRIAKERGIEVKDLIASIAKEVM